ncbi:hypothetical protein VB774_02920 [Pseudanabaena galeata UHCC 0370]|uniref:Uncharacterized protein n=1 Tax=Pseudanabaena galeata UHCC 0370 TaxID=3110310 RepID=A0ABU5TFV7_9CYAN|nr:hypothetical protein [Pseudanabaena galeata]MEA5476563.1 hypothetical protein [Pseudanabaena galeata UHCC 0370]
MLARVWSASILGIDAIQVGVEVDVSGGLPGITLVGLLIPQFKKVENGLKLPSKMQATHFLCERS